LSQNAPQFASGLRTEFRETERERQALGPAVLSVLAISRYSAASSSYSSSMHICSSSCAPASMVIGRAFSPRHLRRQYEGLCPSLVWVAPLALLCGLGLEAGFGGVRMAREIFSSATHRVDDACLRRLAVRASTCELSRRVRPLRRP